MEGGRREAPTDVEGGPLHSLRERVEALELTRAKWQAEMEGLVLKAEGRYRAAAASETRERAQRKAYEKIAEEIGAGSPEEFPEGLPEHWQDDFRAANAEGGGTDGVQPVRLGVEDGDPKARALRGKFS